MSRRFNPADYVDVATRIQRFYAEHVEGRIVTRLETWTEDGIVFCARVYRDRTQAVEAPDATGWAHEVPGAGHVNQTNPVENCETSAIGRALANLGFPVRPGEARPSREEMERAERGRADAPDPEALRRRIMAGLDIAANMQLTAKQTKSVAKVSRLVDDAEAKAEDLAAAADYMDALCQQAAA